MPRRLILLTDGYRDAHTAKTAVNLLRYRPEEVVAVLDREAAGKSCQEWFGLGGAIPVIAGIADAKEANALLIGIAPPGGKLPPLWRPIVLDAIRRGLDIVSGMHEFLCDDLEFAAAARQSGSKLIDVRKNEEHDVAQCEGLREGCLRIHTVANDCSLGKMVVSVEVARGLSKRGVDAKFVATGQTGILVEGDGCPIDRVIADFVNGSAEKLVLTNQHHEVLVVEGQGSLFHPRYSAVTLGLLHGCAPDGLILCYEMGRTAIHGMEQIPLASLEQVRSLYEAVASVRHPCRAIGVAINGGQCSDAAVAAERDRVRNRTGLPTCDVLRHGPDELVDAVLDMKRQLKK